jgi:hypothetical protein
LPVQARRKMGLKTKKKLKGRFLGYFFFCSLDRLSSTCAASWEKKKQG